MTPSALLFKADKTISGCTIPEHITRIILIFGGYCIRDVPARSAAAYEHQLQQKAIILGSKLIVSFSIQVKVQTASAASIWLSSC